MIIKTSEGDKSVASAGVGGAGLGLGIAGTALALMNNGCGNGLFGGLFGGCNSYEKDSRQISALESELAKEKAERYADSVGIGVFKEAIALSNKNDEKLNAQFKEFAAAYAALDKQSAVNNATTTATIACMQQQIAQLQALTKLVVPNSSVCPGWGNVTITPATTTSTPAA